jgi:putative phosphoribosyl transferase
MMFANREQAGKQLAEVLKHNSLVLENKSNLLVVGLPRGGVSVALPVATAFACPLEIIASKKVPFPGQPEYAIGAISSDGIVVLNSDIPSNEQWQAYIDGERQRLLDHTLTIERQFHELAGYKALPFTDKIVIIVDDGIATGMTALAAIETARRRGAGKIIMAAPVISAQSGSDIRACCDEVVAVTVPDELLSIGQYYRDFTQTTNEEVVAALRQAAQTAAA